jgi:hypothetical protein
MDGLLGKNEMQNGGSTQDYGLKTPTSHDFALFQPFDIFSIEAYDDHKKEIEDILSIDKQRLPIDLDINLCNKDGDGIAARGLIFPAAPSFHAVTHVASKEAQLYQDLDSFIARELDLSQMETVRIRKIFFATIRERIEHEGAPSLEESVAILKGIVLVATKLGETLRKEMSR